MYDDDYIPEFPAKLSASNLIEAACASDLDIRRCIEAGEWTQKMTDRLIPGDCVLVFEDGIVDRGPRTGPDARYSIDADGIRYRAAVKDKRGREVKGKRVTLGIVEDIVCVQARPGAKGDHVFEGFIPRIKVCPVISRGTDAFISMLEAEGCRDDGGYLKYDAHLANLDDWSKKRGATRHVRLLVDEQSMSEDREVAWQNWFYRTASERRRNLDDWKGLKAMFVEVMGTTERAKAEIALAIEGLGFNLADIGLDEWEATAPTQYASHLWSGRLPLDKDMRNHMQRCISGRSRPCLPSLADQSKDDDFDPLADEGDSDWTEMMLERDRQDMLETGEIPW